MDADRKEDGSGEEKRKRQTRGGKGLMKAKKKVEPQGIHMWTASRGKKKKVTIVVGLASYGELLLQFCLACFLGVEEVGFGRGGGTQK